MALQRGTVRVLLAIAVVGAGVSLLRDFVCLSDEEKAAKAIEKLGGEAAVGANAPGRHVVRVDLHGTSATDTDLKQLIEFKRLRVLFLSGTKVTDAGLKELKELTNLRVLVLAHTKVTDAGLKELTNLKSLQALELDNTKVTDAGLKELKELTGLEYLRLVGTEVTDAGVKELQAALPELKIER